MKTEEILTYIWMGLSALSALGILFARNVLYAALFLVICLLSMAGIYLMLHAEFLAVTQVMIYAGGVVVLIIFGIMLTAQHSGMALNVQNQNRFAGSLVSAFFLVMLCRGLGVSAFPSASIPQDPSGHVTNVGFVIFTSYVAPFEMAGLLLLISLIAAVVTTSGLSQKDT